VALGVGLCVGVGVDVGLGLGMGAVLCGRSVEMCVGKVEGGREWHGCVSADAGRSMELQMLDKAQIPK
jgi:hypothetical protein